MNDGNGDGFFDERLGRQLSAVTFVQDYLQLFVRWPNDQRD